MPKKLGPKNSNTGDASNESKTTGKGSNPIPATKANKEDDEDIQQQTKERKKAGEARKQHNNADKVDAVEKTKIEKQIEDVQRQIEHYRRDNERILKLQKAKFGITLDNMKIVREEIGHQKSENDRLLRELESRKAECDTLRQEKEEVIQQIQEAMVERNDLLKEKKHYEQERQQVIRNEIMMHQLIQSNKELRAELSKPKGKPKPEEQTDGERRSRWADNLRGTIKLPKLKQNNRRMSGTGTENQLTSKRNQRGDDLRRSKSIGQEDFADTQSVVPRRRSVSWSRRSSIYVWI